MSTLFSRKSFLRILLSNGVLILVIGLTGYSLFGLFLVFFASVRESFDLCVLLGFGVRVFLLHLIGNGNAIMNPEVENAVLWVYLFVLCKNPE